MIISFFWREFADAGMEGVTALWSTDVEQEPALNDNFAQIKKVCFGVVEHNNLAQLQVDDLEKETGKQ